MLPSQKKDKGKHNNLKGKTKKRKFKKGNLGLS